MPAPAAKRGAAPVILGALVVVALAMLGLVAYSLLSGPDYQNDDYQPPPPDQRGPLPPFDPREAQALTTANPIYPHAVPAPVRCDVPPPTDDPATASDEQFAAYLDAIVVCNLRVFDQPVRSSERFELVRPIVNVYHDSAESPCGSLEPNGVFCENNEQIYFSRSVPGWNSWAVIDGVMAHEYGHAMQWRTLLLKAADVQFQRAGDDAEAFELNRRVESQADCFAGLFVRAVNESRGYTSAHHDAMLRDVDAAGNRRAGPGTHGRPETRLYWYRLGLGSEPLGACNTFTAPGDYVR